jgi:ABC-type glycerol-3-phosphate transport system substrate-binding protein
LAYEPLQNYSSSLQKRLAANDHVDLFINDTLSSDLTKNPSLAYADNVLEESALDLSHTYKGLNDNSALATGDAAKLYFIPFGGEIRGLFVNKTLLSHLGLSVPKNYQELLSCCDALAGANAKTSPSYIPLQGNPGSFSHYLMHPYICNLIANASDPDAVRAKINACEDGVEELFKEPLERLYNLVQKYYYNYGYAEANLGNFVDGTVTQSLLFLLQHPPGCHQRALCQKG